ncbi:MAG: SRPBCC family protein [Gemmatimonadetes bacterium]|nr:SRPBCC family protein [Gemmatimonadota bacterium]
MMWIALFIVLVIAAGSTVLRWSTRWGSTPEERSGAMPGDEYLADGPRTRVAMTRAISIEAPPEEVWPWIAQLGRGAGWYSVDWLDNGRRDSARHIVSWIPEPIPGDATAIGYLRHVDPGRALAWWVDGVRFAGSRARLVSSYILTPEARGTRLVSRMSADTSGPTARFALLVFRVIDSIMARRQLLGIRERVEVGEDRHAESAAAETEARDQYQLYEVIYASGETAGLRGKEHAARWRESAAADGIL